MSVVVAIIAAVCEALKKHVTIDTNLVHHACQLGLEVVRKWLGVPEVTTIRPGNDNALSDF